MLFIEKDKKETLYKQIYNQIRGQILSGFIPEGSKLPSTRILAKSIQVSRNTVESSYQQLCSEGYITSRAGCGYLVQRIEPELFVKLRKPIPAVEKDQQKPVNPQGSSKEEGLNFQYGRLSLSDFPIRTFRKLLNQALLSPDNNSLTAYNDKKGELSLRREIMKYVHESRGVKCQPEQIILCSGTLSCLSLLSQLFMRHTKCIAVEEPCYDSARTLFINHGFDIIPVQVKEDGIDVTLLQDSAAKVAYVTPSHQFPMGAVLSINKRLSLIEWAEKNDTFIIEDDYDSELRYNSRPIPSLQSLDDKGRVIYLNTFSKSLAPGLRMGFMILPATLTEEYQQYFSRYHCSVPWLEQRALYAFMHEGHFNRHLRRVCLSNKRRHDILVDTITAVMGDRVKVHGKNAGLHIILQVNNGLSEKGLIEKAKSTGVIVYPVSNHFADPRNYSNNMVLIGFSGLADDEIVRGIKLLQAVWF